MDVSFCYREIRTLSGYKEIVIYFFNSNQMLILMNGIEKVFYKILRKSNKKGMIKLVNIRSTNVIQIISYNIFGVVAFDAGKKGNEQKNK